MTAIRKFRSSFKTFKHGKYSITVASVSEGVGRHEPLDSNLAHLFAVGDVFAQHDLVDRCRLRQFQFELRTDFAGFTGQRGKPSETSRLYGLCGV